MFDRICMPMSYLMFDLKLYAMSKLTFDGSWIAHEYFKVSLLSNKSLKLVWSQFSY